MRRVDRAALLALGVLAAVAVGTASSTGTTYAAYSDFVEIENSAGAGVWAPDPPPECGPLTDYDSIVYGTPGDDVLGSNEPPGGNHPQLVMGYGGNDTLIGGNQKDCLVGGPGDDHIYGNNAEDILLGGAGDDFLDGGNAKDLLDGGSEADTCLGGNGNDTIVDCEPSLARSLTTLATQQLASLDDDASPDSDTSASQAPQSEDPTSTDSPTDGPTSSDPKDPAEAAAVTSTTEDDTSAGTTDDELTSDQPTSDAVPIP